MYHILLHVTYVCLFFYSYVRPVYKRFLGVSLFYNFPQYFPTRALSDIQMKCLSSDVLTHIVTSSLVFRLKKENNENMYSIEVGV